MLAGDDYHGQSFDNWKSAMTTGFIIGIFIGVSIGFLIRGLFA
jgi:hypothetical protein